MTYLLPPSLPSPLPHHLHLGSTRQNTKCSKEAQAWSKLFQVCAFTYNLHFRTVWHVRMHACVCVCTCVLVYMCVHACVCVCILYLCVHVFVCVHTWDCISHTLLPQMGKLPWDSSFVFHKENQRRQGCVTWPTDSRCLLHAVCYRVSCTARALGSMSCFFPREGRSMYGLSKAPRYHLELNYTQAQKLSSLLN